MMPPIRHIALPILLSLIIGAWSYATPLSIQQQELISLDHIGVEADRQRICVPADIHRSASGMRLQAVMQDLEAEATAEGLWLSSTADEDLGRMNQFRIRAVACGRTGVFGVGGWAISLGDHGRVQAGKNMVSWIRPGLTEEYAVSTDGVRQDFLVFERPLGEDGELRLDLEVSGARAESARYGARLVVNATGRELAYSRLKVTDAVGKELAARMEVTAAESLRMVVDDSAAQYPVRIDPTFSDADWISMGGIPGADDHVSCMVHDGVGNLYVGGGFEAIGGIAASRIAKWNGSTWSALSSGVNDLDNGVNVFVYALAVSGNNLYAGGTFSMMGEVSANRIAKWDGTSWSAMGSGLRTAVNAIVISGDVIYAGGLTTGNNIAMWDGTNWLPVGTGLNNNVSALVAKDDGLYAGGSFTMAGEIPAKYIAKWDGTAWSALGSGMSGPVRALAVNGNDLYAGGTFTSAGGVAASRVAKWNGSVWSALGSGADGNVEALAAAGGELYMGGLFTKAGGKTVNRIARWNGSFWNAMGNGFNDGNPPGIFALAVMGSDVYAGGTCRMAGETPVNYLAKWNGARWSAMAGGLNNEVTALAVLKDDLYVGGYFSSTGGDQNTKFIAKWNGSGWNALGSGLNDSVTSLTADGVNLYVGGSFTMADGKPASRVAKWNGAAWGALGSGVNNTVKALTLSGSILYAGGDFTTAGGKTANRVAKWDGSAWEALGTGTDGSVAALVVGGSSLYAGGSFTSAGGVPETANIAKWDGSVWNSVGGGTDSSVRVLLAKEDVLYAGGRFSVAGGAISLGSIGKWDGTSWRALGQGVSGDFSKGINALVFNGDDLYAGGSFSQASGVIARNIARWDGTAWHALGSGTNRYVNAFAVNGESLFVGGIFAVAGDKASGHIARVRLGGDSMALPEIKLMHNGGSLEVSYTRSVASVNAGMVFTVQWSDTLALESWSTEDVAEQVVSDDGMVQSVKAIVPATGGQRFVRLRVSAPAGE